MVTKAQLLNKLPVYVGSMQVLKYDQLTSDIISELLKEHEVTKKDYDKIYKFFWTGNLETTAKNIFNFLKRNIKYDIESGARQTLKSPSALLVQGKGDCKQYSQFIGGILGAIQRNENVKFEWCYRFASYNNAKAIQHVFVSMIYKGKQYEIDPVLNYFNEYKSWTYKIDKKTKDDMALYKISGIANEQVGKTLLGKALKAVSKPVVQVAKAVKNVVIDVASTPARNAFLLLVKLNVLGLATKMGAKLSTIEPKLSKFWKSIGGNYDVLKRNINIGAKGQINGINYIGVVGEDAGAVVLATPIIIKILDLLKEVGIDGEALIKAGAGIAIDKVSQVIDDNLPPAVADVLTNAIDKKAQIISDQVENKTGIAIVAPKDIVIPNIETGNGNIPVSTNVNVNPNTGVATLSASQNFDYKKLILPAVIAVGVYVITKKK